MNLSRQLKLEPYGTPLSNFKYSSEKRRTATTTKAMRDAEGNLDRLWKQVDDLFLDKTRMSLHDFLGGMMGQRELMRSAEWVERLPKPRKAGPGKDIDFLTSLLSTTSLEPATHQTPPSPKTKTKSRGIPGEPMPSDAQAQKTLHLHSNDQRSPSASGPTRSSLPSFAHLLKMEYKVRPHGSTFCMPWPQQAFPPRSSAWVLAPREDEFKRSIVFHEPHPYSRIPFRMTRRYGRRLGVWVEWGDFCSS